MSHNVGVRNSTDYGRRHLYNIPFIQRGGSILPTSNGTPFRSIPGSHRAHCSSLGLHIRWCSVLRKYKSCICIRRWQSAKTIITIRSRAASLTWSMVAMEHLDLWLRYQAFTPDMNLVFLLTSTTLYVSESSLTTSLWDKLAYAWICRFRRTIHNLVP